MSFQIGDLVMEGCFRHSSAYAVHGHLLLRGCEAPVVFDLTGAPEPDLRGRTFEFTVPANVREATEEDRRRARALTGQQIGPTGVMTAARRVKVFACPMDEVLRLRKLSQKPPATLSQCLYLEWFSQNGTVVLEAVDPQIRFLDDEHELPPAGELPALEEEPAPAEKAPLPPRATEPARPPVEPEFGAEIRELDRALERKAERLDREIAGREAEDELSVPQATGSGSGWDSGPEESLTAFLADLPQPRPSPHLSDEEAWQALSIALIRLALVGIAYHVCEHCSIQEAYRLFREKVCPCQIFIAAMPGTIFVHHFSTSDHCPSCSQS